MYNFFKHDFRTVQKNFIAQIQMFAWELIRRFFELLQCVETFLQFQGFNFYNSSTDTLWELCQCDQKISQNTTRTEL